MTIISCCLGVCRTDFHYRVTIQMSTNKTNERRMFGKCLEYRHSSYDRCLYGEVEKMAP